MVKDHQIEQKFTRANPIPRPEHLHEDPSEAEALFALILERRNAMTVTEQPAPTRPPADRPRRPAWAAAAAAFVALIVVGVAAFIGLGGQEPTADQPINIVEGTVPPVADPQPPAENNPPPVETTLPVAGPTTLLDGTWTQNELEPGMGLPVHVVETDFGMVATTGYLGGIWLSQDGYAWEEVLTLPRGEIIEDADLLPGEPPIYTTEAGVEDIVRYNGAVYVFGTITEGAHDRDRTLRWVVYGSIDGTSWSETTYSSDNPGGGSTDALAGENELIVIAQNTGSGTPIFRSEDGITWTRHNPGLNLETAAYVSGEYLAVAAGPEETEEYPWGKRTMVRSADGIEWEQIPGSDFPFNAFPRDLTQYRDRLYMDGLVYDDDVPGQQGMIFYSNDGRTWQQAEMPDLPSLRFVTQLIPSPNGLMALGTILWTEDPAEVRMVPMTTVDGTTFVEIPHPPGLFDASVVEYVQGYPAGEEIILNSVHWPRDESGESTGEPGTYYQTIWTPNN